MSQRWLGCPCAGFNPAATVAGAVLIAGGNACCTPGAALLTGLLSSGAPTAISHLWPGCPCAGLRLAVAVIGVAAVCAGLAIGDRFGVVDFWGTTTGVTLAGAFTLAFPTDRSPHAVMINVLTSMGSKNRFILA